MRICAGPRSRIQSPVRTSVLLKPRTSDEMSLGVYYIELDAIAPSTVANYLGDEPIDFSKRLRGTCMLADARCLSGLVGPPRLHDAKSALQFLGLTNERQSPKHGATVRLERTPGTQASSPSPPNYLLDQPALGYHTSVKWT